MELQQATLRAQHGDQEAFETLVRLSIGHQGALARFVLRDPELAHDAVQNALMLAWRDLPGLRDPECFEAWLNRLTFHAAIEEARKRRRHDVEVELVPDLVAVDDDPAQRVVERDALDAALADLDPDHRDLVMLHVCLGVPLPEAAERLGIPLGTAKSRLHRALGQLRASMAAAAIVLDAPGPPGAAASPR